MNKPGREGPLAGLTLLESHLEGAPDSLRIACAFAARMAADLGAGVIRLEPAGGDALRHAPPMLPPTGAGQAPDSALFEFLNAGKHLLRLPAQPDEVLPLLVNDRLAAVLAVEGDPVLSIAQARGIGAVEFAGFPAGHPDGGRPLSEFCVLAFTGLLDMIGDPAREPLRLGGHQASYATGMAAFAALNALLLGRESGRPAERARVSMIETLLWVNWKAISGAQASGRAPSRKGAQAEFQVLCCRDGWIALVFTMTQWDAVLDLLDDPVLRERRFATRAGRLEHSEALLARLRPWFADRGRDQIYERAQSLGVPLGPVFDAQDLLNDPQHLAREFITTMPHARHGSLRMPRLPVRWGEHGFAPEAVREADLEDWLSHRGSR